MESSIEEALRAKENAEKLFVVRDFLGAKNNALKAQMLCPQLEGISQMVATFEIYTVAELRINGEIDFYSILGLHPSADKTAVKKQYKKMAVMLHPDKNKTVGADGAFKLVSEAWTLLSDSVKRSSYDLRRNKLFAPGVGQANLSSVHGAGVAHNRLDTFWTVCTSCHVQYEYLRKYVNKRLSCKNCRGVFIAVETGAAPVNGSFPYSPWTCMPPDNACGSHGVNGVTYIPTTSVCFNGNGVSGFHSGHGPECVSNVSFQWSSFPGTTAGVVDHNRLTTKSADVAHRANGNISRAKANRKHQSRNVVVDLTSNGHMACNEASPSRGRPPKKRKVDIGATSRNGNEEVAPKLELDERVTNGDGYVKNNSKPLIPSDTSTKRWSAAPAFDARKLLIDKARAVIRKKLEEMKLASAAAAAVAQKNEKAHNEVGISSEAPKRAGVSGPDQQSEPKKTASMPITVPDPDFHDFDKDRSEECFRPRQIWALYDEEDGMPRLYCLIREIISVKPFQIHISYLNSKTDSEFGSVNWVDCGFTKSCGNFRAYNSDIVDQVNVFSHLLGREKAGRGGCIRIYPRSGDIWAVYQNWSPDWNRTTPDEVRHQYEMVEVLDDYSEELGVCVTPLVKLDGFKTVYQRNMNKDAIRWIPRREMLRFSHQVPSCLLKGKALNLPDGCWDLDPAATPDELLQATTDVIAEGKLCQAENPAAISVELLQVVMEGQATEQPKADN
ncbi:hypothetical protein RJ640_011916 [Escallonia rubra]|uniref:J domain-containing protein n=1 Tax=Escallonia rubra TaxID=112253 RepID=A0AA88RGW6_9ASTE|nr:hypothetical protein RJ640_011916 [Escallonia rubra]